MATVNDKSKLPAAYNNEGTRVVALRPDQELRRGVMTALMWEDSFYETGNEHAARIAALIPEVKPELVYRMAVEARNDMYLRHIPLFMARELARIKGNGVWVEEILANVIQRPDELTEYLALYWKGAKTDADKEPLSAGSKRGLARAFGKFNEYSLAKFNRDNTYKLRDVLRLVHPKPKDVEQAALWKRVLADELQTPDTWEVALSGGANKRETFERLIEEGKLGGLAMLRNLRNMANAGVRDSLVKARLREGNFDKVLPFRFITAARYAPRWEPDIEVAMMKCLDGIEKLKGRTALVIDTSPSMWQMNVSAKSELSRFDAAAALSILLREMCEDVHVWSFNEKAYEIPGRRGFALRDALEKTQGGYSCGGLAVEEANKRGYDRIIVLTDGEWHYKPDTKSFGERMDRYGYYRGIGAAGYHVGQAKDVSPDPLTNKAYMINVSITKNGVGYGKWHSIDGWSERIIDYIRLYETSKD